jgi:acetolactate synthase-1/2/3 large subunit
MTGAESLAAGLAAHRVRTVFCLAGTAHAWLLKALTEDGARVISARHETGCVTAADGFARVRGKVGVALIKDEQGLANAITGIVTAQQACSPVVVIVTMAPSSWIETRMESGNDPLDMVKPLAKWVRAAPSAARLGEFLAEAFHQASSGRPGVAILGVRQEYYRQAVETLPTPAKLKTFAPAPAAEAVEAAAALLAGARRPMVICGSGAALSGAGDALCAFAERFRIPVFGHALGRGLVPEDDRLGFGWPLAQPAAKCADVVLCVGMRLGQRFGYGLAPRFSADARFIQIDLLAEEIGRNRPIEVPIVADACRGVEALSLALAAAAPPPPNGDPEWVGEALKPRLERLGSLGLGDGPIHPLTLGRELMARLPADAIYVGDGADIQNWMGATIKIRSGRAFLDYYPFGSMGVGTPLALGAAAAAKEEAGETGLAPRPVVLVTGDGSFGFYPTELNGAVLAGLRLFCIISNDGGWGTEKHGQNKALGTSFNCELGDCDYHLIGRAFGATGERIVAVGAIGPALDRGLASEGVTVLNVVTDPEAGALRKSDPRVVTVAFEDLAVSDRAHIASAVE